MASLLPAFPARCLQEKADWRHQAGWAAPVGKLFFGLAAVGFFVFFVILFLPTICGASTQPVCTRPSAAHLPLVPEKFSALFDDLHRARLRGQSLTSSSSASPGRAKAWNFARLGANNSNNNNSGLAPGVLQLATASHGDALDDSTAEPEDCASVAYESLAGGVVVLSVFFESLGLLDTESPAWALTNFLGSPEKETVNGALRSDETFQLVSRTDLGVVTLINLLQLIAIEGQAVNETDFPGLQSHVAKSPQLATTIQVVTSSEGRLVLASGVSPQRFEGRTLPSIAVECRKHCGSDRLSYSCNTF